MSNRKQLNKPAKRKSLKDHIADKGIAEETSLPEMALDIPSEYFNEEENQKLVEYNKKVTEIDPLYSKLTPRFDLLVRVFVNPLEEKDGILIPNTIAVRSQTKAGPGFAGIIENRFPYSRKAVVISVPDEITDLKSGDIIYLSETPVQAKALGTGNNAVTIIPNKFVHPDEAYKYSAVQPIPVDPTDPNYGYLLVKPYDAKVKLS
jgi:hypothetical protein